MGGCDEGTHLFPNEHCVGENSMSDKKQKKRISIHTIVLIFAIGIFVYSGCKLFLIISEYQKGNKEYEAIVEEVVVELAQEAEDTEPRFQVDFEKLKKMNSEVVGWIRFDEPEQISYPLVHTKDNAKYLKTTFEGKSNSAGTLFVDADNAGDFSDQNTFIYGHNMKNGSMFGQLRKYKDASFCAENPYFYIYTPDGEEAKYQIFAVCIVEDTSASYDKHYETEEEFLRYLNHVCQNARYGTSVELSANSKIVSLSTCTNASETQRLLVHGVKLEKTDEQTEE